MTAIPMRQQMRGVYEDLRDDGWPRWPAFKYAYGVWAWWPIHIERAGYKANYYLGPLGIFLFRRSLGIHFSLYFRGREIGYWRLRA